MHGVCQGSQISLDEDWQEKKNHFMPLFFLSLLSHFKTFNNGGE